MNARYIGLQERINKPPLILVNILQVTGVIDTVVYDPVVHNLIQSDQDKIREDLCHRT